LKRISRVEERLHLEYIREGVCEREALRRVEVVGLHPLVLQRVQAFKRVPEFFYDGEFFGIAKLLLLFIHWCIVRSCNVCYNRVVIDSIDVVDEGPD
jgi:hypothetical protein